MSISLLYPRTTVTRRAVSLDGLWRFQFDPGSVGLREGWTGGLPAPIDMPVPASFNDFFTDKESRDYTGDFWYETEFFVPGEWEGREIVLRFGSATHRARVFVNGQEVARHVGGFLPFSAAVTDVVRLGAFNRLSVLLNNELSETMIPCGTTVTLSDGRKAAHPYFDFFNYAGLHRPVKLLALPEQHVTDYSVSFRLGDGEAAVDYRVETSGDDPVALSLRDAQGRVVAEAEGKSGTLTVSEPVLWRVGAAYLYRLEIRIRRDGRIVDEYFDEIGLRSFEVRDGRFLLNGEPVYLKGFGKHEDADIRGRGLDLPTLKRDFECLKWIGANCFRTSHYPYAEELYYMADREGFLIIDEVPAVGMMESLQSYNAANQGTGLNVTWFEKETTPELLAHHKDCVREMITRDKNHPSVVAWSLLNEPETTHESAVPYFEEIFSFARSLDPQRRPMTFALLMMSMPDTCRCWQFCDFVSLNRYYGWYVLGGSRIGEAERLFHREMDAWAKVRGERPFLITEYGADTLPSEHKLPSVMWSQEYQDEYLQMNHRVFDSYDWVQGELVWNFADFQTTETIHRANGNKKGIFTRQRQPKDAAFLLRRRWREGEK